MSLPIGGPHSAGGMFQCTQDLSGRSSRHHRASTLLSSNALPVRYSALMDEGALAQAIGGRIRQERQARNWTLDHLADVSGVSRRMIITVEQGEANPSVATLLKLSDALGIGLPALVEPPEPTPLRLVRAGAAAVLWSSAGGGKAVLVAGSEPPDVVELWDWTLAAGDEYRSEPHADGTRELLHVHCGQLTVEVAEQRVDLQLGDAASFAGDVPHAYLNTTEQSVHFSLSVFEPGVGIQKGRS